MSYTLTVRVPVELVSGEFDAIARVTLFAPSRSYLQPEDPPDVRWESVELGGERHDPIEIEQRFAINLDEWSEQAIELCVGYDGDE
jgi:hypothetical protein